MNNSNAYIFVRVLNQYTEIQLKLKKTALMSKLKKGFSEYLGVAIDLFRFEVNGRRVSDEDTPQSLGLEDGHLINVFNEVVGG